MEFLGTKGKWHTQLSHKEDHKRISIKTDDILCVGLNDSDGDFISVAICGNSKHEVVQANAELIAEAGNIRQQIPFSLTELKRQRDEMLEMLKEIVRYGGVANFDNIKQLITEATELN